MHDITHSIVWRQAFGVRLRQERLKRNMCQSAIAQHLGVSVSTVSCWENGLRAMPIDRLPQIAHLLEVSPSALLPEDGAAGKAVEAGEAGPSCFSSGEMV